jgi:Mg-chelatase subunit ChlD
MDRPLHSIYNLILLDESRSMRTIMHVTLNGLLETFHTIRAAQQQFPGQAHFVTLVTFNGADIKTLIDRQPIDQLPEMPLSHYHPQNSTPLYDALCKSLSRLELQIDQDANYSVLVSILTDGAENSSKEFSVDNATAMIKRLKGKDWAFTYMGADHCVEKVANALAIDSFIEFNRNEKDINELFKKERTGRNNYYFRLNEGLSGQDSLRDFW